MINLVTIHSEILVEEVSRSKSK